MSYDEKLEDLIIQHVTEGWKDRYDVRDYILYKYNINAILDTTLYIPECMEKHARYNHKVYGPCTDYIKYGHVQYYFECAPLPTEPYRRHTDKLSLDREELKKIIAAMKRVKVGHEDGVGMVGPTFTIKVEQPVEEIGSLFD